MFINKILKKIIKHKKFYSITFEKPIKSNQMYIKLTELFIFNN
jgi:hypothetical protein